MDFEKSIGENILNKLKTIFAQFDIEDIAIILCLTLLLINCSFGILLMVKWTVPSYSVACTLRCQIDSLETSYKSL